MNASIHAAVRRFFRTILPTASCAGLLFLVSTVPGRSDPAGVEFDIVSDSSWICSASGPSGWQNLGFDDASWTGAVELTGYPYPPGNFIPGTAAEHIWEAGTFSTSPAYFRRNFHLVFPPTTSQAIVRVDDTFQFYVNGVLVGSQGGVHSPQTYDITPHLRVGDNVFALRCTNTIGGWRALLFDADVMYVPVYDIVSDTSWVCSPVETAGWQEAAFDDSTWTDAVVIGGYPYPPGHFIPGTAAEHIWEAGTTATSPAFFRRSFWLPLHPGSSQAVVRIDDAFDFYVNGVLVGSEPGGHPPRTYDVTAHLNQGANVFALKCWNLIGTFRSMLFDADVSIRPVLPQARMNVVSDTTWRGSPAGPSGWPDPGFDDSSWPAAVHIAGYPYPPGGYIPGTSAKHIWCNPPSAGRAFLRKTVEVPGFPDVTEATVRVDDAYDFYVNGMLAGSKHTVHPAGAQSYDITPFLRHGTNVFAIEGWDLGGQQAALFDVDIRYYPNQPPVADAGPDRSSEPGANVHLSGAGSSDDYTIFSALDFAWTIESAPAGSTASLVGDDTPYPGLVPDLAGDYVIQLAVADEQGLSDEDMTTLAVAPLLASGGFEDGLAGWTATGTVTLQSGPPYVPTEGGNLVSFNDRNLAPDGVLSQVVPTVPGMVYRLEFDVGVLSYVLKQQKLGLEVTNGSVLLSDTVVLNGRKGGAVDWVSKNYLFTADDVAATIVFRDLSTWTNGIDLLIDNVRVTSTALPLLVASEPVPGVPIEVSPDDLPGEGDGSTVFERIYNPGTVVELIAPQVDLGRSFFNWLKNGAHHSTDRWIEVTVDDAHQMTAVYWGGEPMITEQPVDAAALEDGTAEFRVVASGGVPLDFQWRFEGSVIPGAESPVLVIDPVRPEDEGSYDVIVGNIFGTETSDPASLTIGSAFAGLENGSFEFDFQGWTVSGNLGVKASAPYAATDGAKLVAFNAANSPPNGVLFQMFDTTPGQPYVLGFDMGVLAYNTRAQSLEVEVTGSPSLVMDTFTMNGAGGGKTVWQRRELPFSADSSKTTVTFRDVSPWTNALDLLLDRVEVTPVIVRNLTVKSDSGGGFWDSEVVGVDPADIHSASDGKPEFARAYPDGAVVTLTAPPELHLFGPGTSQTFLFRRWLKNGSVHAITRTAQVTMDADVEMTCVFEYSPPEITQQPADLAVALGDDAMFNVVAQQQYVGEVLGYQWRFNGVAIPGAMDSTYLIPTVQPSDAGTYDVIVTNAGGATVSDPASLVVASTALANGGFESGFDGWNTSGNVRVQAMASAPEGANVAVFNSGNSSPNGVVSQSFVTMPAVVHSLRFDLGVLAYVIGSQDVRVTVTGESGTLADEVFRISRPRYDYPVTWWETRCLNFVTGDSTAATVTFRDVSTGTNAIDLMIDHVMVLPYQAKVTTSLDEDDPGLGTGDGDSLREILDVANWLQDLTGTPGVNHIGFAGDLAGETIALQTYLQLTVDCDVAMDATDLPGGVTVSADQSRAVQVKSGRTVTLAGIAVTDGWSSSPGGVEDYLPGSGAGIMNSGTLVLDRVSVSENDAIGGYPCGAGIYNEGDLTLIRSTVSNNGSGEGDGGGIANLGTLSLINSTVSGNAVYEGSGGGISGDVALLRNSTVSDNTTWLYPGDFVGGIDGALDVVENSIVAGNFDFRLTGGGPDWVPVDVTGPPADPRGVNLIGGDPMLSPLGDYGGPTSTMPPALGSPAIDGGVLLPDTPVIDQRGITRPQGAAPDIGAVEVE